VSSGKDTPSGHWEIAGLPVRFDWGYFPDTVPAFPAGLTEAIIREGKLPGILGNCHAPGTEIIERFGEEHIRTGKPICYTSVDSVLQIAAHETHFGLERLYELCLTVRRLADPLKIGRVIARPFVGETPATFQRTHNRRDYAVPPPEPTLLDRLTGRGSKVIAVGKIGDIFAHRGISEVRKAGGNMAMFDKALGAMDDAHDGDLVFANFVDFDTEFGHRRDVAGYAAALEAFDRRLPEAFSRIRPGDLLILTADHGNDPTWRGTDHTRERVPVIGIGPGLKGGDIGLRPTFADIGETVADHLGLATGRHGTSFLATIGGHA
jgi:phosphopentomutase